MTPLSCQLLVLAKEPVAGRVKTRLTPALTPGQAAEVAAAALADTLAAVAAMSVARRVLVLDGAVTFPLPGGFEVIAQRGDGLAERLTGAFADAAASSPLPLLLIGMDTPQVTPQLLQDAARSLLASDAVLGLAADGGWWALGLHAPHPQAFAGVPMSEATTGAAQAARLAELGLHPVALPVLRDIDTVADLAAVRGLLPTGSALSRLALSGAAA